MAWVKSVGGKLKSDVRYSSKLCFNTFPTIKLNENDIKNLENFTFRIIEEREKFSDKTISEIYGKKMPISLKQIHDENDDYIDEIIFQKKQLNDDEKIGILLSKYEECVKNHNKELFNK